MGTWQHHIQAIFFSSLCVLYCSVTWETELKGMRKVLGTLPAPESLLLLLNDFSFFLRQMSQISHFTLEMFVETLMSWASVTFLVHRSAVTICVLNKSDTGVHHFRLSRAEGLKLLYKGVT